MKSERIAAERRRRRADLQAARRRVLERRSAESELSPTPPAAESNVSLPALEIKEEKPKMSAMQKRKCGCGQTFTPHHWKQQRCDECISAGRKSSKPSSPAPPKSTPPPHSSLAGTPPLDETCDRSGNSFHELAEDLQTLADVMKKLNRRQRNLLASLLAEYV